MAYVLRDNRYSREISREKPRKTRAQRTLDGVIFGGLFGYFSMIIGMGFVEKSIRN